jgi:RNA polymerase sigma-70 factor (ECF subfamily)
MRGAAARLEWWLLACAAMGGGDADADLVAGARRGDPSAFDEIVRRHQRRVYNLAYRMLRRREDAEDVTQEAFLRAFESLPRVRESAAIGAYVCRIAANLCVSWLRARRGEDEVKVDPDSLPAAAPSAEADEMGRRAREAVAQLPPRYRLAVVAYYLEGQSYEEAARTVGVKVRTLKTRLYRARKMLREMLAGAVFCEEESGP